MASSNQTPDVLFSPIAANADASDINTIPQTYDPANYGYAAQNVGFPTECRLPVLNPDGTLGQGRAPRMQDWNGIMKLVSSHNFFLQNGGSYTFNPTVSSNIGGYPKNAVLWYFPENEAPCLVYSLINDNTNNFVDDPTLIDEEHWKKLSFGDRISSPFFFGWSQYFENAPYNASWLASNGQYNASSLYPDFWTQLTGVELNGSLNVGDTIEIGGKTYVKRGLPVVLSTGTITDYDFVVNQNDQTFRLPLLNGEEDWVGNSSNTLSTANIVLGTPFTWTTTQNGFITFTCYRVNVTQSVIARINGQIINFSGTAISNGTPRPGFWLKVKKGDNVSIEAEAETLQNVDIAFIPAVGNGTLYYYVGDTVQDASLINAGAVLGQLSNKADIDASNFNAAGKSYLSGLGYPSDSYIDVTVLASDSNYTAPANGWFNTRWSGSSSQHYIQWRNETNTQLRDIQYYGGSYLGDTAVVSTYVKKGEVVKFRYAGNPSTECEYFRFYYAEGENNV